MIVLLSNLNDKFLDFNKIKNGIYLPFNFIIHSNISIENLIDKQYCLFYNIINLDLEIENEETKQVRVYNIVKQINDDKTSLSSWNINNNQSYYSDFNFNSSPQYLYTSLINNDNQDVNLIDLNKQKNIFYKIYFTFNITFPSQDFFLTYTHLYKWKTKLTILNKVDNSEFLIESDQNSFTIIRNNYNNSNLQVQRNLLFYNSHQQKIISMFTTSKVPTRNKNINSDKLPIFIDIYNNKNNFYLDQLLTKSFNSFSQDNNNLNKKKNIQSSFFYNDFI